MEENNVVQQSIVGDDVVDVFRREAKALQPVQIEKLLKGKNEPIVSDLLAGNKFSLSGFIESRRKYIQRIERQKREYAAACEQIEQEKQRIAQERIEKEHAAEARRMKVKRTIGGAIAGVVVLTAVVGVVFIFTKVIPGKKYDKAMKLYQEENYNEAYKIFADLGNYSDSKTYASNALEKWQDRTYREALNAYVDGKFEEAQKSFELLGGYRSTGEYLKRLSEVLSMQECYQASVGDLVKFGSMSGNYGESATPLSWLVLEKNEGKMMLILEDCIQKGRYHDYTLHDPTWENCTMREWLNGEFLDKYFTDQENSVIQFTTNANPDNPQYGTEGGSDTKDRVFLLSYEEMLKYFPEESERYVGLIGNTGNKISWLLRTKGESSYEVMVVNADGSVNYEGEMIFLLSPTSGIRPAVWIDIGECELFGDDAVLLE